MRNSIAPFINKRVLVLNQTTPATVAARALYERRVGSIVVSDNFGHVIGLVTDRDLSNEIIGFDLPKETPISEVMTMDVLSVNNDASISDVLAVMEENGIRRVPVIEKTANGKDRCIGMITLDDLIASELVSVGQLSRIVKSQVFRCLRLNHSTQLSTKGDEHKEQTLNRFNKTMERYMNIPRSTVDGATFYLLKALVQRLPYTEAARFISQLPSLLHEDLLGLPAGPNEYITRDKILLDLCEKFQLDEDTASLVTKGFWLGLENFMDPHLLEHVADHLPMMMQDALGIQAPQHETNIQSHLIQLSVQI